MSATIKLSRVKKILGLSALVLIIPALLLTLLGISPETSSQNYTITLTWDANPPADRILKYRIKRVNADGSLTLVGGTAMTFASLIHVRSGYHKWVATAVNKEGESAPSDPVEITLP
jgi:hypothetical protein